MAQAKMERPIKVLLVDDHAVVRSGFRRLLEQTAKIAVTAEAENGEDAYRLLTESQPDVTVMDLSMPGMGGLETMRRILARFPGARILVFSMHENAAFARQAFKAGAHGYVTKASAPEVLVTAVQAVARGERYLGPDMAHKIALDNLEGEGDPLSQLSAREFELFRLLAEGQSVEEIAGKLCISQKTVANYHTQIKQKLNIANPVELVRMAIKYRVISQ